MIPINIAVEVKCNRPSWILLDTTPAEWKTSKYRIYVDSDLITERTWIWDNNTSLTENIWIYGEYNTEYLLQLDPVVSIEKQAKFTLCNVHSQDDDFMFDTDSNTGIRFKIINTR